MDARQAETFADLSGCAAGRFLAMTGAKPKTAMPVTAVIDHCKSLEISQPDASAIRPVRLSAPDAHALLSLLLLIRP
jgi:hypothetical protein